VAFVQVRCCFTYRDKESCQCLCAFSCTASQVIRINIYLRGGEFAISWFFFSGFYLSFSPLLISVLLLKCYSADFKPVIRTSKDSCMEILNDDELKRHSFIGEGPNPCFWGAKKLNR
jgi:hypothetical protein